MQPGTASADQLVACHLASTARGLAAALAALDPAGRRRVRALDRWYARWAAQVREHLELLQVYALPVLAERGVLHGDLLDAIASDHAWIDELVGDLGDAIGIVAFGLGEPERWLGRAAALADHLAAVLAADADRQAALIVSLAQPERRPLVARPTRFGGFIGRFRPDPLALLATS
jgi:hypothetical protein